MRRRAGLCRRDSFEELVEVGANGSDEAAAVWSEIHCVLSGQLALVAHDGEAIPNVRARSALEQHEPRQHIAQNDFQGGKLRLGAFGSVLGHLPRKAQTGRLV